jgi:hypothetical protein
VKKPIIRLDLQQVSPVRGRLSSEPSLILGLLPDNAPGKNVFHSMKLLDIMAMIGKSKIFPKIDGLPICGICRDYCLERTKN